MYPTMKQFDELQAKFEKLSEAFAAFERVLDEIGKSTIQQCTTEAPLGHTYCQKPDGTCGCPTKEVCTRGCQCGGK